MSLHCQGFLFLDLRFVHLGVVKKAFLGLLKIQHKSALTKTYLGLRRTKNDMLAAEKLKTLF